jgi:hypothetical protein
MSIDSGLSYLVLTLYLLRVCSILALYLLFVLFVSELPHLIDISTSDVVVVVVVVASAVADTTLFNTRLSLARTYCMPLLYLIR